MIVVHEVKPKKSHVLTLEIYGPKRTDGDHFLRAVRQLLRRYGKSGGRISYSIQSDPKARRPARRAARRARRRR